jgi:hypothetical protein
MNIIKAIGGLIHGLVIKPVVVAGKVVAAPVVPKEDDSAFMLGLKKLVRGAFRKLLAIGGAALIAWGVAHGINGLDSLLKPENINLAADVLAGVALFVGATLWTTIRDYLERKRNGGNA